MPYVKQFFCGLYFTLAMIIAGGHCAWAMTASGSASVNISDDNLVIQEDAALHFGKILIPASGVNTVVLKTNGTYNKGDVIEGFQQAATYTVQGTPNERFTVTSNILPASVVGVDFDQLKHKKPPKSYKLNGSGTKSFNVGGRIRVDSSAQPGEYTFSYEITAEYE